MKYFQAKTATYIFSPPPPPSIIEWPFIYLDIPSEAWEDFFHILAIKLYKNLFSQIFEYSIAVISNIFS